MINDGRFARIELMLGRKACEQLRNSFVTVVGLGAVGSYAVEGLARAGIGKLRVVDFDKIAPSNINRQLYALTSTIGRLKCEVARERILDINPDCIVETVDGFMDGEKVWELVGDGPDIVIDAIDGLNTKVSMIQALRTREMRFISCLGAAMRTDPTKIRTGPLSDVHSCRLGSAVRQRLIRRGIPVDFPCVYSEEPIPNPLPVTLPDHLGEKPVLERGRTRNVMGSLPTITGMFGLTAANLAIQMLTEERSHKDI